MTGLVSWSSWRHAEQTGREELAAKGEVLVFEMLDLLEDSAARMIAVGGLFHASDHVTADEFATFVSDVGLIQGMMGLGYVDVVPGERLGEWLDAIRREIPGFDVFDVSVAGTPVPVAERDVYYPLVYAEPEEFSVAVGFDVGAGWNWLEPLLARRSEGVLMSEFVDLLLDVEGRGQEPFFLGAPLVDEASGDVDGLLVSVLYLDDLVAGSVAEPVTKGISWTVTDVTDGPAAAAVDPDAWVDTIEFAGRTWQFAVVADDPGSVPGADFMITPILGGAISLLIALALRLAIGRAQERRQVGTLESRNQAKDEFLAAVSHRLRTPLTAVVGFSEILKGDDAGLSEEDRRELLSTIAVQAIELGHLFDNLLTVSRGVESSAVTASIVNVADELHVILDTMDSGDRVKVTMASADPDAAVIGDQALIRQVLRNLLANAAAFGAHVKLDVEGDDSLTRILVRDDGPGVNPDRVSSIFELYSRAGVSEGQPPSMGVGLYVSRRLARRMGGDIIYRRAGGWTMFEFILPTAKSAVGAAVRRKVAALN